MITDEFKILNWNVFVIYEATCDDIDFIIEALKDINCPNKYIKEALDNLEECKLNSGLTYNPPVLPFICSKTYPIKTLFS